jgi:hypothetical protein
VSLGWNALNWGLELFRRERKIVRQIKEKLGDNITIRR